MPAFTSAEYLAILLSLKVAIVATLVSLPFGFGVAYLMTYRQFRGKLALDVAVNLPLDPAARGDRVYPSVAPGPEWVSSAGICCSRSA